MRHGDAVADGGAGNFFACREALEQLLSIETRRAFGESVGDMFQRAFRAGAITDAAHARRTQYGGGDRDGVGLWHRRWVLFGGDRALSDRR